MSYLLDNNSKKFIIKSTKKNYISYHRFFVYIHIYIYFYKRNFCFAHSAIIVNYVTGLVIPPKNSRRNVVFYFSQILFC